MIRADLEGADLESRVANRAGVVSQYTGNAAVTQPELETVAGRAAVRSGTHGGHRKITQYMYQQMPEQSGGGCSGICWYMYCTRLRARSAAACVRRARRGSGYADVYLHVQGSCR